MSLLVYCFYMIFLCLSGAKIVVFPNIQTKYNFFSTKKARPKAGFSFSFAVSYYSTTTFFTSHVAADDDVLVYLNAMVTDCPA